MNLIDLLLLVVLGWAVLDGLRRGFVLQIVELVGFVGAIIVGLLYYQVLADWLINSYHLPVLLAKPVGFFGIWFAASLVLSLVFHLVYRLMPKFIAGSLLDRAAGIIPAFLKNGVLAGVALTLVVSLPVPTALKNLVDQSVGGPPLMAATSRVTSWLEARLGGRLADSFNFVTVTDNKEVTETIRIAKIANEHRLRTEPKLEQDILALINQERAKEKLAPLVFDDQLAEVARAHSKDMWLRGYFSHTNPDGADPFDRIKAAGITYQTAGENLALAPSLGIAHDGLMRSPAHRDNILHDAFGRVGIGIISAGSDGLMITQNFRN